jgi:peptide chain release factor 3
LFAQDRETVEEAYPGDIVGLTNPGAFNLGDTVTTDPSIRYDEVPEFVPEVFARLSNQDVSKLKSFEKGVQQLCQEGLIQLFWDTRGHRREPILGAIGKLQFEVVQYRLMSEYSVKSSIEPLGYEIIRWLEADEATLKAVYWGSNALPLTDDAGAPVVLIASEWSASYLEKQNEKVKFSASPATGFTALASGAQL